MIHLKNYIQFAVVLLLIITASCHTKPQVDSFFTQSEIAHFRNYSRNDTVCFCDSIGNIEKMTIQTIIGSYNQTGVFIKNMYTDLRIVIENNGTEQDLFTISKDSNTDKPNIIINFKDFINKTAEVDFEKLNKDTILLNGKEITNYYRIENELKGHAVKTIIWTDSKGLTAFQLDDHSWMTLK